MYQPSWENMEDGEHEEEEECSETSLKFTIIAKTRFCYRLDLLERCIRNRKVLKELPRS